MVSWWHPTVGLPFVRSVLCIDLVPVRRLAQQQRKLEAEEDEAGDDIISLNQQVAALQSKLSLAAARLARVRKIRRKVQERKSEALRRGLQGLDDSDGASWVPSLVEVPDADGRVEVALGPVFTSAVESQAVAELSSLGVSGDVDWASLGLGSGFAELGSLEPPATSG
jgi:hypothetical protein